jgi:hypothetical protein
MRYSNARAIWGYFLYAASLSIACASVHSFSVLGLGEMLIYGFGFFAGPLLFAFFLAKTHERLVIAAAHIFLAVLIHREVKFKDPLILDRGEQFALLRATHDRDKSWWVQADMAYDLARSVKADATRRFKSLNPVIYWVYPPSVVLGLWGVLCFFFIPAKREGNEVDT